MTRSLEADGQLQDLILAPFCVGPSRFIEHKFIYSPGKTNLSCPASEYSFTLLSLTEFKIGSVLFYNPALVKRLKTVDCHSVKQKTVMWLTFFEVDSLMICDNGWFKIRLLCRVLHTIGLFRYTHLLWNYIRFRHLVSEVESDRTQLCPCGNRLNRAW
jgi:hypothetical protein